MVVMYIRIQKVQALENFHGCIISKLSSVLINTSF